MSNVVRVLFFIAVCSLLGAVPAYSTGRIDAIRVEQDVIQITIETTPGRAYQLQCCADLSEGEWINIGVPFQSVVQSVVKEVSSSAVSCWFRVIRVPPIPEEDPPPPPGS